MALFTMAAGTSKVAHIVQQVRCQSPPFEHFSKWTIYKLMSPPDFVLPTKLPPVLREGNSEEITASHFTRSLSPVHIPLTPTYLPLFMLFLQLPISDYKASLQGSASLSKRGNKTGKSLQKLSVLSQNHSFFAGVVPVSFQRSELYIQLFLLSRRIIFITGCTEWIGYKPKVRKGHAIEWLS